VKLGRSLFLIGSRAAWKLCGIQAAGRPLVRSLGSPDEDVRTIAGMLLVKAGRSAEPLLEEALERRENLPMVLSVLADIGDPTSEPQIERFRLDPDPEVAKAAAQALRQLRLASPGAASNR
jgi:HEAT repeat protein